jgi:hypothetical protein
MFDMPMSLLLALPSISFIVKKAHRRWVSYQKNEMNDVLGRILSVLEEIGP